MFESSIFLFSYFTKKEKPRLDNCGKKEKEKEKQHFKNKLIKEK